MEWCGAASSRGGHRGSPRISRTPTKRLVAGASLQKSPDGRFEQNARPGVAATLHCHLGGRFASGKYNFPRLSPDTPWEYDVPSNVSHGGGVRERLPAGSGALLRVT